MVKKPVREHSDANMTTRVLVSDIMNSPVVSASPHDSIKDIASKMKQEQVGSIIIMENENPLGIVTDWDIVSNAVVNDVKPSMLKASDVISEKAAIVRGEIGRSAGNISGYCDDCGEWSDLLQYNEGTFSCEECRGETIH